MNHFIFPYAGNKRKEIPDFYQYINFDDITTIIEPYCGSAAMSYYISQQNPKKFKYVLNDNDEILMQFYHILKDEKAIDEFNKDVNNFVDEFNKYEDDAPRKQFYMNKIKDGSISAYYIKNKYCGHRVGIYPQMSASRYKKIKHMDLRNFPIYNFLQNENVELSCDNALDLYNKYVNNTAAMLLLDPPYINSTNTFYSNPRGNIYEYLYSNNIKNNKARTYLILENIWIIKLLFQNNTILCEYAKRYESTKKHTSHILISA
jgi:hypothetical protein